MGDLQRQIGERAQAAAEPTLLDLVRKMRLLDFESGLRKGQKNEAEYRRLSREADDLHTRIAALVPTLPVQARDYYGVPLWIHGCGEVRRQKEVPTRRCDCFNPDGPWRQLLVAPDAAPNGDRAPEGPWCQHCGMARTDGRHPFCTQCQQSFGQEPDGDRAPVGACWKCGLTVGEIVDRGAGSFADGRLRFMHAYGNCPTADELVGLSAKRPQPDILREVMAALGVDRAEDVVGAVAADRELVTELLQQRDEAHAEIERIRGQWRNDAEIGDEYAAWADRLARAVLKHTDVHETEEASGSEELWGLALDALTGKVRPDGRIVLRLPEPPPGTVALIGVSSGATYPKVGAAWGFSQSETGVIPLGELLDREGELRIELAPEPEPQQPPTAAEVWRGMQRGDNARLMTSTLAEALDREAGL